MILAWPVFNKVVSHEKLILAQSPLNSSGEPWKRGFFSSIDSNMRAKRVNERFTVIRIGTWLPAACSHKVLVRAMFKRLWRNKYRSSTVEGRSERSWVALDRKNAVTVATELKMSAGSDSLVRNAACWDLNTRYITCTMRIAAYAIYVKRRCKLAMHSNSQDWDKPISTAAGSWISQYTQRVSWTVPIFEPVSGWEI